MDIVVTGYAAFEGSRLIYEDIECREKLLTRYPVSFFDIFDTPVNAHALSLPASPYADGSDGGVLAALWRLLKAEHTGGVYDQSAIPVLQQTVEICEFFGLNPYRLSAPGCRVWLSREGQSLTELFIKEGIAAAVVGHTVPGAGIVRSDSDVRATLRKPEKDELLKVLSSSGSGSLKRILRGCV